MKNESTMTDIFQDFPFVVELPYQWSVYIKCIQIAKDNEFIKTLSEFVAKRSNLVFPEIAGKSIKQMDIMVRMLPSLPSISWNKLNKVLPPVIDLSSDDEEEDKLIITKYPYIDRPMKAEVKNKGIQTDIADKLCLDYVNCKEIQNENADKILPSTEILCLNTVNNKEIQSENSDKILPSTEILCLNTVNNKEIQMDSTEETSVSTDRFLSSVNHIEIQTDTSVSNTCELKRKSILKKTSDEPMNKVRKIPENIQRNEKCNVSKRRSYLFNSAKWKKMMWVKSRSVEFAKHLKVNRVIDVKSMRCDATFHSNRDFEAHHERCVDQPLSEPGTSSSSQTEKSACSNICEICVETFSDPHSLLKHLLDHFPSYCVKIEHTGDENASDNRSNDGNNSGFETQEECDEV